MHVSHTSSSNVEKPGVALGVSMTIPIPDCLRWNSNNVRRPTTSKRSKFSPLTSVRRTRTSRIVDVVRWVLRFPSSEGFADRSVALYTFTWFQSGVADRHNQWKIFLVCVQRSRPATRKSNIIDRFRILRLSKYVHEVTARKGEFEGSVVCRILC